MAVRELVRPLPLSLIVLFAIVAVTDFVHTLREEKLPPPDLVKDEVVQFAMHEPVFDLRSAKTDIAVSPVAELLGPWSALGSAGTWVLGDGAALEKDVYYGAKSLIRYLDDLDEIAKDLRGEND